MHSHSQNQRRQLGQTQLHVGPISLGCWPLAGMTREGITHSMAVDTILAALDAGITHLDTAYCYGESGESERAIAQAIIGRRDQLVIAGKCGIHWLAGRQQVVDGRPQTLRAEVETSLARLGIDFLDLLYLHAPDPTLDIEVSAAGLFSLLEQGLVRSVGVSNVNVSELKRFSNCCPVSACQSPYNMLQRGIEVDLVPWCLENRVSVMVYWPLMKGLLSGSMDSTRHFPETDSRHKYPMFQGEEFLRNLAFVDSLRPVAARLQVKLSQLVLAWTAQQPGITSVLVGATNPQQARENAGALGIVFNPLDQREIANAIASRGTAASRPAVKTR